MKFLISLRKCLSDWLIIFDCDGVLVDSEPVANSLFASMLNEIGIPISLEESARRFTGRSMPVCVALIEKDFGVTLSDSFLQTYKEATFERFRKELNPVRGIKDVLAKLSYQACVASSGSHDKINTTLGITGLDSFFAGKIFSSQDVSRGKPFPDLFLHAAKVMGFQPNRCIVVEDATPGIEAAKAAGMKVLGYSERSPQAALLAAGATTFSDMNLLPGLISEITQCNLESSP